MKVVTVVPGSGGQFYCENCFRDSSLVRAFRRMGHDAIMAPMYLPMFTDEPDVTHGAPVFFGGVSLYLRDRFPSLRRMPYWMIRSLDSAWVLRLAARHAGSTRAHGQGRLTLSMIEGDAAYLDDEVDRMVEWLLCDGKPDIVHLSTVLLAGLARRIRERLAVPIVCSLQDEHVWLDALDKPYDRLCWDALGARLKNMDGLVTVSEYYRDFVAERLGVPAGDIRVVRTGIDLAGYGTAPIHPARPTIGYLARMGESLGLGILSEAFISLKRDPRFRNLRLRAMGGQTGDDRRFLARLQRSFQEAGVDRDVEFLDAFDRSSRITFLDSLSVLSVPMPDGEAYGTFIVEALAAGVPVVQPRVGAFPELVNLTGGGLLCDARNAVSLAGTLAELLGDFERARQMGRRGRVFVHRELGIEKMVAAMMDFYRAAKDRGTRRDEPQV